MTLIYTFMDSLHSSQARCFGCAPPLALGPVFSVMVVLPAATPRLTLHLFSQTPYNSAQTIRCGPAESGAYIVRLLDCM